MEQAQSGNDLLYGRKIQITLWLASAHDFYSRVVKVFTTSK